MFRDFFRGQGINREIVDYINKRYGGDVLGKYREIYREDDPKIRNGVPRILSNLEGAIKRVLDMKESIKQACEFRTNSP